MEREHEKRLVIPPYAWFFPLKYFPTEQELLPPSDFFLKERLKLLEPIILISVPLIRVGFW